MSCFRVVWFFLFSVISLNHGFYIREPVQGSNSIRNMSPAMTYDDFLRWTTIYSTNLRKLGLYPVVTADDERRSVELFNQNFAEFLRMNRDDESQESAEVISFENLENGVNNYVTISTELNAKEFDINNIQTGPTYAISNNDAEQVFDITSNWVGTDPSNYFIVVKNGENIQVNQVDGTETVSKGKTDSDSDTKDDYIEENFEDIPTFIEALSSLDWELEPEIVNSANDSTEPSDIFDEVWERDEQNEREMGMVMNVLGVDGESLIQDVAKIMGDEDEQFSADLDDLIAMESSQEEKTISFRPNEEASSEYSDERMPAQIIEPRIENVISPPDSNMYAANEEALDHLEISPDPRITPPRILEVTDTKLEEITNEPATNSASSKREQEYISTSPIKNSAIEPTATKSEANPSNDTIEDILGEVSTDTADDFLSSKQILKSETNEDMESLLISPEELLNYFVDTPTSLNATESQPESLNPDAVHLERKAVQQREKATKDRQATETVDSVLISPDELFEIMDDSFEIDNINITSGSNHIPQYVFNESTGTKFEQQETRFEEKSLNTTLKNNDNQDRDFKDHPSPLKLPESESSDEILPNQMEDSLEQEPSNTVEQTTYNHLDEDIAKKPENLAPGSFTTLISPHDEISSIDSALMESVSTASLKDKDLLKNVETNVGGKFGTDQLINMSSENVSLSNQIIKENISKGLVPSSISPTKDISSPAQTVSENQSEPLNSDASNRGHYVAELEVVEGVLQLYNDPLKESSSKKRILEPLEPETLQTLYNEVPASQNQPRPQNKSIQIQIENSISVKNTSMKVDPVDDMQKEDAAIEKIIQEEPLGSSEPKRDDDDSWEDGTLIPIIFPNMNITEVDSTAETWKEDQSLRISGADRIENEEKALNTTLKSNNNQGRLVENHPSSSKLPESESSDEILPNQMEDIEQVFKNPLVSSENTTVTKINNLKEINAYKVVTTPKNNTNLKQIAESDTLKDDANGDFVPVQIGEFIGKSYSKQSTNEDTTEEELKPILGKVKQPNYNVYMPFDLLNENEKAYDIFKPKTEDEDDSDDSEEIPRIHQYNDRSDIPIQDYSDYYDYRDDYQL